MKLKMDEPLTVHLKNYIPVIKEKKIEEGLTTLAGMSTARDEYCKGVVCIVKWEGNYMDCRWFL